MLNIKGGFTISVEKKNGESTTDQYTHVTLIIESEKKNDKSIIAMYYTFINKDLYTFILEKIPVREIRFDWEKKYQMVSPILDGTLTCFYGTNQETINLKRKQFDKIEFKEGTYYIKSNENNYELILQGIVENVTVDFSDRNLIPSRKARELNEVIYPTAEKIMILVTVILGLIEIHRLVTKRNKQ
jgi:hypothetical protein